MSRPTCDDSAVAQPTRCGRCASCGNSSPTTRLATCASGTSSQPHRSITRRSASKLLLFARLPSKVILPLSTTNSGTSRRSEPGKR
ncbi:hypothetical protein [Lysobacter gummosus]|uniref:hypothetical protein n=1 Tax=Lysobacter gummosus TaxID=262324 RepID=UPI003636A593